MYDAVKYAIAPSVCTQCRLCKYRANAHRKETRRGNVKKQAE